MLTDGFLTETRSTSGSGLYTYCKIEGLDYQYLAVWMNKKDSRKAAAARQKKITARKLFSF